MLYDVTTIGVRPGTHPKALAVLKDSLSSIASGRLLACWYSDLGALNQILVIKEAPDAERVLIERDALLTSDNPLGLNDFVTTIGVDLYSSLPFIDPMTPGQWGPVFEVRLYTIKPGNLAPTIKLWKEAVPARSRVSPLLAAMHSLTGIATRLLHIWPYPGLDERSRLRAKAVADGVWPPPGGPDYLHAQQSDIFFAAPFSPIT